MSSAFPTEMRGVIFVPVIAKADEERRARTAVLSIVTKSEGGTTLSPTGSGSSTQLIRDMPQSKTAARDHRPKDRDKASLELRFTLSELPSYRGYFTRPIPYGSHPSMRQHRCHAALAAVFEPCLRKAEEIETVASSMPGAIVFGLRQVTAFLNRREVTFGGGVTGR